MNSVIANLSKTQNEDGMELILTSYIYSVWNIFM